MSLLQRSQPSSKIHNSNTIHMDSPSVNKNSSGSSNRILAASFPPNEDVLLIIHRLTTYSVPLSRIVQESKFLGKRYNHPYKSNTRHLRLSDGQAPVIVESFITFFNSNRRYVYPNLPIDQEIEFHIRICQLADDHGVHGLWDEAFDRYTNRLSKDWIGLGQSDKERIVKLVYEDCEVKTDRMMKNALIKEIGITALYLISNRKFDDDLVYGHARLGHNSMVAIAAKVEDDEVDTLLHDIEWPLVELTGLYLNARRYSLRKKLKSAALMWREAAEMVSFKRTNPDDITDKEWGASEEDVVMHWVAKMLDWYRQGYAKDQLFDNNSQNPFDRDEDEIAEW